MSRDEARRRRAELFAADQAKRALAEPEIARAEARLAQARAELDAANNGLRELEAELEQARREAEDPSDTEPGP